jgi:hypothetical protein
MCRLHTRSIAGALRKLGREIKTTAIMRTRFSFYSRYKLKIACTLTNYPTNFIFWHERAHFQRTWLATMFYYYVVVISPQNAFTIHVPFNMQHLETRNLLELYKVKQVVTTARLGRMAPCAQAAKQMYLEEVLLLRAYKHF